MILFDETIEEGLPVLSWGDSKILTHPREAGKTLDGRMRRFLCKVYLAQLEKRSVSKDEMRQYTGLSNDECEALLLKLKEMGFLAELTGDVGRFRLTDEGRRSFSVVLAGGVFDVIHVGHLAMLQEAKTLGDLLIVVVARDSTVEKLKGKKPVFPEEPRRFLVECLKPVDKAVLGYEGIVVEQVIRDVAPDIVAVGYDQEDVEKAVRQIAALRGTSIKVVRMPKYGLERLDSSTKIKRRVVDEWR